MKWLQYLIGAGAMFFSLGIFFIFMDIPNHMMLIIIGVLCIAAPFVYKEFTKKEQEEK